MSARVLKCWLPRLLSRLQHYSGPSTVSPWQCVVPIVNLEEKSKLAAVSADSSAVENSEFAKLLLEKKREAFLCE